MMGSEQWDVAAHMRIELWEETVPRLMYQTRIAPPASPWQPWLGKRMMEVGTWLLRTGGGLTTRGFPDSSAVHGEAT